MYFRDRLLKASPMKWTYQPNCTPSISLSANQRYYFDNKRRLGDHPSTIRGVFPKHLKLFYFFILAALLLLAVPGQAQFERVFGTALDESFSKVIQSGSSYYVLGSGEITDGQPARAMVSRLNAAGELVWTLSLNTASAWKDAVLTPAGNLLVVGHTLPDDANSKSIMGSVTATGTFAWVRSYDNLGKDGFLKIVRNLSPQNPGFP